MITVTFTPPPSANKLWVPRKTKAGALFMSNSLEYVAWSRVASKEIWAGMLQQNATTLMGKCVVTLRIPKFHASSDLDNRIKPCVDALQHGGTIANDKNVIRYRDVEWAPPGETMVTAEIHEV